MANFRSVALGMAIAAAPAAAHAAAIGGTSFSCNADQQLTGINWGDFKFLPSAAVQFDTLLPAVQRSSFSCNQPTSLSGGAEFAVLFDVTDAAQKADLAGIQWFFDTGYKEYKEFVADGQYKELKITTFDLYGGGDIENKKFFAGLKIYTNGDASSAKFFVNDGGSLVLDPPMFDDSADIQLYSTPLNAPEPSALMLAGSGLAAAAASLRRRRRKNPW